MGPITVPKLTWGEGVRLPQAVADLAFQIKALLPASLGDIAAASGQSLAETGASFRILRDDQYRFQAVQTQPLYQGLVQIALAQGPGFQICAVILLADLVQRLDGIGYSGDYSFEVFNDDYQQLPLDTVCQRARSCARWVLQVVLRRLHWAR